MHHSSAGDLERVVHLDIWKKIVTFKTTKVQLAARVAYLASLDDLKGPWVQGVQSRDCQNPLEI